jgi:hypothetical protein
MLNASSSHFDPEQTECLLTDIRQFDILHVIRAWRAHSIQVGRTPLSQGDRLIVLP